MISAVVPTAGAAERLGRLLPSVSASLAASGLASELLVVDDGASLEQVPEGARLLPLEPAGGYGRAVNKGARAAVGDLLLVLNDDVRLERDCVARLASALRAQGTFAAVPAILSPLARCGDEGGKAGRWRAGLVEIEEVDAPAAGPTLYPVGCCFLCRRETFLELGGYDEAFAPYFWEDVDLGWRAWRRGLASLYVPDARCHHEGSATIGAFPMDHRVRAWERNRALFHLRNLRDPRRRAAAFGAMAAQALFDGRPAAVSGLAAGLSAFRDAGPGSPGGLDDQEILARGTPA